MTAVRQLTSIREQLWLLAHDHRDLRPLIDVRALAVGLTAAVLTDLMLHHCITIQGDRIYLGTRAGPADDPIAAGILAALDVTPPARLTDVLHAARPDLPEATRYTMVDPSLPTWTRQTFNRRLVYPGDSTDIAIDLLCALAWALNLHHKLLMPFSAAEADPLLQAITDRIPRRAGTHSPLIVMPHVARQIRHTIGDLATAAF